jgi:peptide/nickel transport system permease protein
MPEPSVSTVPQEETEPVDALVPAAVQTLAVDTAPEDAGFVIVDEAATKKLGFMGWLAIGWMVAIVGGALLVPFLPVPSPNQSFLDALSQGPTMQHIFGTDSNGQDLFARVLWGARASLLVATFSVLLGLIVGGTFGLIGGYYKRRTDTFLSYFFNTFLAIPQLVLALAIVAVFANEPSVTVGKREFWLVFSIGLVSIPIIGRITRASTLTWSQRDFVLAAKAMGTKNRRIIMRDVLPNVAPAMFSIALLGMAVVIVLEGGLSILGVGVPTSTPSWGNMIALGRNELTKLVDPAPQVIFAPALCIFLTVLSLNYLGDVIRARFEVREAGI